MYVQYKKLLLILKVCLTNYNWFKFINEREKTVYQNVIPYYFQKHPPTHTHTGTNLEREQQLEFL